MKTLHNANLMTLNKLKDFLNVGSDFTPLSDMIRTLESFSCQLEWDKDNKSEYKGFNFHVWWDVSRNSNRILDFKLSVCRKGNEIAHFGIDGTVYSSLSGIEDRAIKFVDSIVD